MKTIGGLIGGDKSPVTYGVYRSESAYNTYTGASMGIPEYGGLEEMQKHLDTIIAGGYNIQCMHYRTLVKVK